MRSVLVYLFVSIVIVSLGWIGSIFAIEYTLDDATRVYDRAQIIDETIQGQIDQMLLGLEHKTNTQTIVITLPDLEGRVIEDVALQFGRENGIGDGERNTGLIVLVAIDERQWRIEVGYGLEGIITDQQAYRLGTDILVPAFRQGEYGEGLLSLIEVIVPVLQGEQELQSVADRYEQEFTALDVLFFGGILAFFFGAILSTAATTKKSKQGVAGFGSGLTGMLGSLLVGWTTIWVVIPLFFLRWIFLSAKRENTGGFSGGGRGYHGGSFSGGGFGGFGGGSFGGGGASGSW